MKYITILNFGSGTVHQYKIDNSVEDFEEFIDNEGFRLSEIQWMVHSNKEIIKEKIEQ
jgi:hypothetical protein